MADLVRLTEVIEPEAKALGFDLVRVKMMPSEAGDGGEALQIMAEDPATGQLVIDQCAALSRRVSERLDALEEEGEVLIAGAYHLEVSSPGIDRPLVTLDDFETFRTLEAKVEIMPPIQGQKKFRGFIEAVEDDNVVLRTDLDDIEIPFDTIQKAKLVLTDDLIEKSKKFIKKRT